MAPTNPIVSGNVDSNENAARLRSAPSLFGLNVLDDSIGRTIRWATGASAPTFPGTDITDSDYPVRRLYDRMPWTASAPDGTQNGNRYLALLIDLNNQGTDDEHTIDTFCMQILNGDALPSFNLIMAFAEDDDPTFIGVTNPPITAMTINNANIQQKLLSLTLGDGDDTYQNVRYIRLLMDRGLGNTWTSVSPLVGHVAIGKRRQLGHEPDENGYDEGQLHSEIRMFESDRKANIQYVLATGQTVLDPSWELTSVGATGIDEISNMQNFFQDIGYGSKNFIYIDQPIPDVGWTNQIARGHWMQLRDPELFFGLQAPGDRKISLPMQELTPFQVPIVGLRGT